jgi:hypothetical protein
MSGLVDGLRKRTAQVKNPLDRIAELEREVKALKRELVSCLKVEASSTSGATEQGWLEVVDADGNTGYVRIYGGK